jgi:hypothetical protein
VIADASRIEQEPTADEVAASRQRASDLHVQAEQEAGALARARAAYAESGRQAGIALEGYRTAVQARQDAQVARERAEQSLLQAQLDVGAQRAALGRWARQAYASGGVLTDSPTAQTLLGDGDTDDLGTTLVWLSRIGHSKSQVLQGLARAQAEQRVAAQTAGAAVAAAEGAERAAQDRKGARDAAVAAQGDQVEALSAALRTSTSAAAEADRQAAVLVQARAAAREWAGRRIGPDGNIVTGPVGDCPGGDTSRYGNGQIPLFVLCPIVTAPGELLRADAAYAFNRLSRAYVTTFGAPICVTDSYRSYEDQVRVYAEKPDLAARPGTSNHGWGTATDLCGGIEQFGSATHAWMLANAPLFGWFHPAWAEPGGSKPEPWHWEFGG